MSEIGLMSPPPLGPGQVFDEELGERECRACGCSQFNACVSEAGIPCHWIEADLCSACETTGG